MINAWVRSTLAMACFALVGALAPAAYAQDSQVADNLHQSVNLVVNGDFSANGGSLAGWTTNQNVDNIYWQFNTDGTTDYAIAGCFGDVCINGTEAQQNFLSQTIPTCPFGIYKLTFTYDGGGGGENELKVLVGHRTLKDLVNIAQGPNTYTVYFLAERFDTKLNFLGRQDNAYSFLSNVSVTQFLW
jgi:hypothetical protein